MKTIKATGTIVSDYAKEVYDDMGLMAVSPSSIINEFPSTNEDVEVIINSGGGDVFAGFDIYNALKDYSGKVHVRITTLAASAASVIAMAGDKVSISPVGQMMIHNVWTTAQGNHHDLQQVAARIGEISDSVANAYVLKTGKSLDEIKQLMDDETYFSAQKALNFGLVDEVFHTDLATQKILVSASAANTDLLPQSVIDEYFNQKKEARKPQQYYFL